MNKPPMIRRLAAMRAKERLVLKRRVLALFDAAEGKQSKPNRADRYDRPQFTIIQGGLAAIGYNRWRLESNAKKE